MPEGKEMIHNDEEEFHYAATKLYFKGRCDMCNVIVDNKNYGYSSGLITSCNSDPCLDICNNLIKR